MLPLDDEYGKKLDAIAKAIQASDELAKYLEEEEDDDYLVLRDRFEPEIKEIHLEVAAKDPLQLIAFEQKVFDESFEGLFLPRILGYAVLRGEVNDKLKYIRSQNHFQDALLAICNSANFDILKKRIGQTIQIGFALSSDIWITNLINSFDNRKIRYFLQSQKLDKYRVLQDRKAGYYRYSRQFDNENYQTATFPTTTNELSNLFSSLKNFLIYRASFDAADNASIIPHIKTFITNKEFWNTKEYLHILGIYAGYWNPEDWLEKEGKAGLNSCRKNLEEFEDHWFGFTLERIKSKTPPTPETDRRWSSIVDRSIKDELAEYFDLLMVVHDNGLESETTHEAVRLFHNVRPGLSKVNECVRKTIYLYFHRILAPLDATAYTTYFETTKLFPVYMDIFANQQFNQDLKDVSMSFVKKCLKKYTDKRGRDYQDIKKFVARTFRDLGFLTDKQIVELFKTRRKRKPVE